MQYAFTIRWTETLYHLLHRNETVNFSTVEALTLLYVCNVKFDIISMMSSLHDKMSCYRKVFGMHATKYCMCTQ